MCHFMGGGKSETFSRAKLRWDKTYVAETHGWCVPYCPEVPQQEPATCASVLRRVCLSVR